MPPRGHVCQFSVHYVESPCLISSEFYCLSYTRGSVSNTSPPRVCDNCIVHFCTEVDQAVLHFKPGKGPHGYAPKLITFRILEGISKKMVGQLEFDVVKCLAAATNPDACSVIVKEDFRMCGIGATMQIAVVIFPEGGDPLPRPPTSSGGASATANGGAASSSSGGQRGGMASAGNGTTIAPLNAQNLAAVQSAISNGRSNQQQQSLQRQPQVATPPPQAQVVDREAAIMILIELENRLDEERTKYAPIQQYHEMLSGQLETAKAQLNQELGRSEELDQGLNLVIGDGSSPTGGSGTVGGSSSKKYTHPLAQKSDEIVRNYSIEGPNAHFELMKKRVTQKVIQLGASVPGLVPDSSSSGFGPDDVNEGAGGGMVDDGTNGGDVRQVRAKLKKLNAKIEAFTKDQERCRIEQEELGRLQYKRDVTSDLCANLERVEIIESQLSTLKEQQTATEAQLQGIEQRRSHIQTTQEATETNLLAKIKSMEGQLTALQSSFDAMYVKAVSRQLENGLKNNNAIDSLFDDFGGSGQTQQHQQQSHQQQQQQEVDLFGPSATSSMPPMAQKKAPDDGFMDLFSQIPSGIPAVQQQQAQAQPQFQFSAPQNQPPQHGVSPQNTPPLWETGPPQQPPHSTQQHFNNVSPPPQQHQQQQQNQYPPQQQHQQQQQQLFHSGSMPQFGSTSTLSADLSKSNSFVADFTAKTQDTVLPPPIADEATLEKCMSDLFPSSRTKRTANGSNKPTPEPEIPKLANTMEPSPNRTTTSTSPQQQQHLAQPASSASKQPAQQQATPKPSTSDDWFSNMMTPSSSNQQHGGTSSVSSSKPKSNNNNFFDDDDPSSAAASHPANAHPDFSPNFNTQTAIKSNTPSPSHQQQLQGGGTTGRTTPSPIHPNNTSNTPPTSTSTATLQGGSSSSEQKRRQKKEEEGESERKRKAMLAQIAIAASSSSDDDGSGNSSDGGQKRRNTQPPPPATVSTAEKAPKPQQQEPVDLFSQPAQNLSQPDNTTVDLFGAFVTKREPTPSFQTSSTPQQHNTTSPTPPRQSPEHQSHPNSGRNSAMSAGGGGQVDLFAPSTPSQRGPSAEPVEHQPDFFNNNTPQVSQVVLSPSPQQDSNKKEPSQQKEHHQSNSGQVSPANKSQQSVSPPPINDFDLFSKAMAHDRPPTIDKPTLPSSSVSSRGDGTSVNKRQNTEVSSSNGSPAWHFKHQDPTSSMFGNDSVASPSSVDPSDPVAFALRAFKHHDGEVDKHKKETNENGDEEDSYTIRNVTGNNNGTAATQQMKSSWEEDVEPLSPPKNINTTRSSIPNFGESASMEESWKLAPSFALDESQIAPNVPVAQPIIDLPKVQAHANDNHLKEVGPDKSGDVSMFPPQTHQQHQQQTSTDRPPSVNADQHAPRPPTPGHADLSFWMHVAEQRSQSRRNSTSSNPTPPAATSSADQTAQHDGNSPDPKVPAVAGKGGNIISPALSLSPGQKQGPASTNPPVAELPRTDPPTSVLPSTAAAATSTLISPPVVVSPSFDTSPSQPRPTEVKPSPEKKQQPPFEPVQQQPSLFSLPFDAFTAPSNDPAPPFVPHFNLAAVKSSASVDEAPQHQNALRAESPPRHPAPPSISPNPTDVNGSLGVVVKPLSQKNGGEGSEIPIFVGTPRTNAPQPEPQQQQPSPRQTQSSAGSDDTQAKATVEKQPPVAGLPPMGPSLQHTNGHNTAVSSNHQNDTLPGSGTPQHHQRNPSVGPTPSTLSASKTTTPSQSPVPNVQDAFDSFDPFGGATKKHKKKSKSASAAQQDAMSAFSGFNPFDKK